jgi:hypothetical protein
MSTALPLRISTESVPDDENTEDPAHDPRRTKLSGPYQRVEPPDQDVKEMDVVARFTASGVRDFVRFLSGMVLANRPWKLFSSFKGTLTTAFDTGAYALVITALWILADSVGRPRLLLLMLTTAIVAMVVWIILAHHLWERPDDRQKSLSAAGEPAPLIPPARR